MESYQELHKQHDLLRKQSDEILNKILHHKDYIRQSYFYKVIKYYNTDYITSLINNVSYVSSGYNGFSYTIDDKFYFVEYQYVDKWLSGVWFYNNGKNEDGYKNCDDYIMIKKHYSLYKIVAEYFKHKHEFEYLETSLKKLKLDDNIVIGLLLVLNKLLK